MDSWRPQSFSLTPPTLLKIMASDVDGTGACPQWAYVKARKGSAVTGAHGWAKKWDSEPFPLKLFQLGLEAYLNSGSRPDRDRISVSRAAYAHAHPGLRTFLDHALDNYLEFLGVRERPGEPARYLGWDTQYRATSKGALGVWAPVYAIGPGHVEVHRLRIKRTQPEVTGWAHLAAYVTSNAFNVEFVSVVDVSLFHDPRALSRESILLNRVSAQAIETAYLTEVRPKALKIVAGGPPSPGHGCGGCSVAGICNALIPMDGALKQAGPGPHTRAISANDLILYERCPARWFLEKKSNLPVATDRQDSSAVSRGRSVHTWLKLAHRRGRACIADDLPMPAQRSTEHVGSGALDDGEYAQALPFLLRHLEHCPLAEGTDVLVADETLYGWDATSDTVVAGRPDLMYVRDGVLVLRETKTTEGPIAKDPDDARDGYDGIVYWWLVMCTTGYLEHFGATRGRVELEILGPEDSACHIYSTNDEILEVIAETRVRHLAADWHEDTTWASRPNALCVSCPVSVWCPDRDEYTAATAIGAPF